MRGLGCMRLLACDRSGLTRAEEPQSRTHSHMQFRLQGTNRRRAACPDADVVQPHEKTTRYKKMQCEVDDYLSLSVAFVRA